LAKEEGEEGALKNRPLEGADAPLVVTKKRGKGKGTNLE